MFFTQEDFRKIEQWLQARTIKDSQLSKARPIDGTESLAIVQDGRNLLLSIGELERYLTEIPAYKLLTWYKK